MTSMRKLSLLIASLLIVALSGCGKKEPATEDFTHSGVVEAVQYGETQDVVTVSTDVGIVDIKYDKAVVQLPELQQGYEVTVTGSYYTEELWFSGEAITIDSIPLDIQLGYTGYDLISKEYDATYQSLMAKVQYNWTKTNGGRQSSGSMSNSYYMDQDENAIYTNIIAREYVGDVYSTWTSMEYVDRNTKDRYYLYNYGDWVHDTKDDTSLVTFAQDPETITISDFYLEDTRVVVEGTCSVKDGSYVSFLLGQVLKDCEYNLEDFNFTFTAKFDKETQNIIFMEYLINDAVSLTANTGTLSVDALNISLMGITFNNTGKVTIPNHVYDLSPDESIPEETVPENTPMYQSVFGLVEGELTPDFVMSILGDPHNNEYILQLCNPDELVTEASFIFSTYSMEQFVEFAATYDSLTPQQQIIVDACRIFLQDSVE